MWDFLMTGDAFSRLSIVSHSQYFIWFHFFLSAVFDCCCGLLPLSTSHFPPSLSFTLNSWYKPHTHIRYFNNIILSVTCRNWTRSEYAPHSKLKRQLRDESKRRRQQMRYERTEWNKIILNLCVFFGGRRNSVANIVRFHEIYLGWKKNGVSMLIFRRVALCINDLAFTHTHNMW